MSVAHYENFPVASILLPAHLRAAVAAIYHFARSADDIADEGQATPQERLAQLAEYRTELASIAAGRMPKLGVFQCLAPHITAFSLPLQPFYDLLDAFSQDVEKTRYQTYPELLDYCRRSANPVGRLMLALYGVSGEEAHRQSDAICTALQLINFYQDVALDWQKGRVYLPQVEMARYHISETQIADTHWDAGWAAFMDFQVERARHLLLQGAPLVHALPGRIGWELRLIVQGGATILNKLQRVRGDMFHHRPVLTRGDWIGMAWRTLFM